MAPRDAVRCLARMETYANMLNKCKKMAGDNNTVAAGAQIAAYGRMFNADSSFQMVNVPILTHTEATLSTTTYNLSQLVVSAHRTAVLTLVQIRLRQAYLRIGNGRNITILRSITSV